MSSPSASIKIRGLGQEVPCAPATDHSGAGRPDCLLAGESMPLPSPSPPSPSTGYPHGPSPIPRIHPSAVTFPAWLPPLPPPSLRPPSREHTHTHTHSLSLSLSLSSSLRRSSSRYCVHSLPAKRHRLFLASLPPCDFRITCSPTSLLVTFRNIKHGRPHGRLSAKPGQA